MVADPLIHKMRTAFSFDHSSSTTTAKKKKTKKPSPAPGAGDGAATKVGILSFEVANAMSRAVNLYRSLSDSELSRLRSETFSSHGVRLLVSSHDPFLLSLALAEKLDDLNRVASVASRLGRRCSHPALLGFEHVYADLLAGHVNPSGLLFLSRDVDANAIVRKMERLAGSTAALYAELEVLAELEQSAKRFPPTPVNDETRRTLEHKIRWQRQDVRHLRDASLWNQTYDKVVLLLSRAVCAIHSRIRLVFGETLLGLHCLFPDQRGPLSGQIVPNSGAIKSKTEVEIEKKYLPRDGLRLHCGASPGRLFMECLSLSSSVLDSEEHFENESCLSHAETGTLIPPSGEQGQRESSKSGKKLHFGPKSRLTMFAPPSTIGGSALALHYANVIIIIEKLLRYPHLVGEEARDDLYQMLPSSLRMGLRKSLKSYVKNLAIYDAPLAHDWKEALEKILVWLAPMAHNMIRWQTERNFEQQQIVLKGSVLLLQTLYFADREKAEAVICELLVGLNYICRYEQQQNALLDCASSLDFEDCMEWHMQ
ncbi:protein PSK SIMULATOR 1 [Typha angustifolia]|uniref:protein PSK SIMULATOR 1 n=1 Tax=Typha angustifolia TaxID=59011 RepID=UPI003C2B5D9E